MKHQGWWPPAEAATHLYQQRKARVLPDAGFRLETQASPIECYLEWERGAGRERALERYSDAFEQGKLSPERCDQRLTRLQTRLEELHAQRAKLSPATREEAGPGPPPPKSQPSPTNSIAPSPRGRTAEDGQALLRLLI